MPSDIISEVHITYQLWTRLKLSDLIYDLTLKRDGQYSHFRVISFCMSNMSMMSTFNAEAWNTMDPFDQSGMAGVLCIL